MVGITVYIAGIGYWFKDDGELIELLDMNCDDAWEVITKDCDIEYDN